MIWTGVGVKDLEDAFALVDAVYSYEKGESNG